MTTPNERPGGDRLSGAEDDVANGEPGPPTQPFGALVPPVRNLPGALDAASEPPPRDRGAAEWRLENWPRLLGDAVNAALDAADRLGDAIASRLGLHRENP